MPRHPQLPRNLRGRPFSVAEATESGVPRTRLRGASILHPYRGVYGKTDADYSHLAQAAALAGVLPPDARFSHFTAALAYGAPVPTPAEVHVSVPASQATPRRRAGLVTHQRLRADEPRLLDGLLVSSPEQTFLDLARNLPLDDLVVLGDFLVRRWTTPDALAEHVATSPRGTRGVVPARAALSLVRAGVDSPQETRLRLVIVRDGLPEPSVNPVVFDAAGGWLGQPDLAHLLARVASQFDGDVHRTNRRRWRQDIARDESFRDNGWIVLRTTGWDVAHPGAYLTRLRRALRERGSAA